MVETSNDPLIALSPAEKAALQALVEAGATGIKCSGVGGVLPLRIMLFLKDKGWCASIGGITVAITDEGRKVAWRLDALYAWRDATEARVRELQTQVRLAKAVAEKAEAMYSVQHEDAMLLYRTLAKHAPDALAAIKEQLHGVGRESDKVMAVVQRLKHRIVELRAALKPFAKFGAGNKIFPDDGGISLNYIGEELSSWRARPLGLGSVSLGDFRAAAREIEKDQPTEVEVP